MYMYTYFQLWWEKGCSANQYCQRTTSFEPFEKSILIHHQFSFHVVSEINWHWFGWLFFVTHFFHGMYKINDNEALKTSLFYIDGSKNRARSSLVMNYN